MTHRNEIIAISEYYNIPMRLAALRLANTMDEGELENIIEWWLNKKEEEE